MTTEQDKKPKRGLGALLGTEIKLDGKNSAYHFNLGVALTQCNDYTGAAKAYKECLKISDSLI